jgi:hypothetical protein
MSRDKTLRMYRDGTLEFETWDVSLPRQTISERQPSGTAALRFALSGLSFEADVATPVKVLWFEGDGL